MTVTVGRDEVQHVLRTVQALAEKRVLIGVPSETADRDGETMNNAAIGYVMETGEPAHNVPARPWLVPGVEAVMPKLTRILKAGADKAMQGDAGAAERALEAAGIVAESSVRHRIDSNIPPPLAPSTIRGRRRARQTQSMRQDEKNFLTAYKNAKKSGMSEDAARAFAQEASGIKTLVNTHALLNSVTHVIRKAK